MASFDLGFDVAAPPEISPEDADILNDIFSQDIVFEEVVMSTSTYEAQQELDKAFSEDRKENFAPASRFIKRNLPQTRLFRIIWLEIILKSFLKNIHIYIHIICRILMIYRHIPCTSMVCLHK